MNLAKYITKIFLFLNSFKDKMLFKSRLNLV